MVYDRLFLFTYNLLSNIPQAVIYLPKGYCYNNNIILRGEVFPILKQLLDGVYVVVPETQPKYPYSNSMYFDDDIPAVIDLGLEEKRFQLSQGLKSKWP
jgi:hypothetical protein